MIMGLIKIHDSTRERERGNIITILVINPQVVLHPLFFK